MNQTYDVLVGVGSAAPKTGVVRAILPRLAETTGEQFSTLQNSTIDVHQSSNKSGAGLMIDEHGLMIVKVNWIQQSGVKFEAWIWTYLGSKGTPNEIPALHVGLQRW